MPTAPTWTLTVNLVELDGTARKLDYFSVSTGRNGEFVIRSAATGDPVFDVYTRVNLTNGVGSVQLPANDPANLPYDPAAPNWFTVQVGRAKYKVLAQAPGSTHPLREFIDSTSTPLTPSQYGELAASVTAEAGLRASGDAASVATAATDATSKANAAQVAAIAAAATDATNKVATETTRAQNAESTNATAIASKASTTALTAETTRATNAEAANATAIQANAGAITGLQNGTNSTFEARLSTAYAAQTGSVRAITGPTLPALASGTKYVWTKTDPTTGDLVDIVTGVAA